MAGIAAAPFPFATLETLAGFLSGSGTGAVCAAEMEPVSKIEPCVGEDLLTMMMLLSGEPGGSC